jgi:sulfocyanin
MPLSNRPEFVKKPSVPPRSLTMLSIPMACVFAVANLPLVAAEQKPADSAGHAAAHEAMGLKKELIEGLTSSDFLRLSEKSKTVLLTVVAAYSSNNYGMNFNGFAYGNATYTIPAGWTVEVTFINPSPVPHSAIVLERDQVKKLQVSEPAFKGAAVVNHITGISTSKSQFQFVADEAGEYAIACGFPSHSLAGHWIALDVSASAKVPVLKLGEAEPVQASPPKK